MNIEQRSARPDTVTLVASFATFDHYGGGQRARLRVADGVVLEALDGWGGTDAVVDALAVKLEDHLIGLALKV